MIKKELFNLNEIAKELKLKQRVDYSKVFDEHIYSTMSNLKFFYLSEDIETGTMFLQDKEIFDKYIETTSMRGVLYLTPWISTQTKVLGDLFTFDTQSEKSETSPYGIFAQNGVLHVSDSQERINGTFNGLYIGNFYLGQEESQKVKLEFRF